MIGIVGLVTLIQRIKTIWFLKIREVLLEMV